MYRRGRIWWLGYSDNRGNFIRESSHSASRSDAQKLLNKRLGEVASGKPTLPREERVTINHLLDYLVRDYEINQKASTRTVKGHVVTLQACVGSVKAVRLTTEKLRGLIQRWQKEGLSNATINRRLAALKRAFNLARIDGWISNTPHFPRLQEHNVRQIFFERGEFMTVLKRLPDDGLREFIEWLYVTGMRRGQAAKLRWRDFDLETWTIRSAAKDVKARREERIPIAGDLVPIIKKRLDAKRADCPYIFHRNGKQIQSFRKSWARACRAAGLGNRRPHDFRRTGVRNLIRSGVDQAVAMRISGHKTDSVFRRYNIVKDDDVREALRKVSSYTQELPSAPQNRTIDESSPPGIAQSIAQSEDPGT